MKTYRQRRRDCGGGRKAAVPHTEEQLVLWIDYLRANNLRITCSDIQQKAAELGESECEGFKVSRGWLEKFFKRNGLSLCRRTTVSQQLPQNLIPKITSFIVKIRRLRHEMKYPLSSIGNMDETPLWLDMPGETTVA